MLYRSKNFLIAIVVSLLLGCGAYKPQPFLKENFADQIETKTLGDVTVSVKVLNPEQSKEIFGVNMAQKGIQPVWLEIDNKDSRPYILLSSRMDPNYFTPTETAYLVRSRSKKKTRKITETFYNHKIPTHIPANTTRSGFAFVNLDLGLKQINVVLLGKHDVLRYSFLTVVEGLFADVDRVDFDAIHKKEEFRDLNLKELRAWLEKAPATTTNKSGNKKGDPINMVFIGDFPDILSAYISQGWHITEAGRLRSGYKTAVSFMFGTKYRYSPVSALYYDGRHQDMAIQMIRENIHERSHFRIWLTTATFQGKPVFLIQASRDIGVRMTTKSKTLTTHKIDPAVDDERWYMIQEAVNAQALEAIGFVKGVGEAPMSKPRHNLTGDPYYTDGHRAVLIFSAQPVSMTEIERLPWETPGWAKTSP